MTESFHTPEYLKVTLDTHRHLTCWQIHVRPTSSHEFDGFSPTILNFL
jgi:hypothetical protein